MSENYETGCTVGLRHVLLPVHRWGLLLLLLLLLLNGGDCVAKARLVPLNSLQLDQDLLENGSNLRDLVVLCSDKRCRHLRDYRRWRGMRGYRGLSCVIKSRSPRVPPRTSGKGGERCESTSLPEGLTGVGAGTLRSSVV